MVLQRRWAAHRDGPNQPRQRERLLIGWPRIPTVEQPSTDPTTSVEHTQRMSPFVARRKKHRRRKLYIMADTIHRDAQRVAQTTAILKLRIEVSEVFARRIVIRTIIYLPYEKKEHSNQLKARDIRNPYRNRRSDGVCIFFFFSFRVLKFYFVFLLMVTNKETRSFSRADEHRRHHNIPSF